MSENNKFPKLIAIMEDGTQLPIEGDQLLIKFKQNKMLSISIDPESLSFLSYSEDNEGAWCSDKGTTLNIELKARNILNLSVNSFNFDNQTDL